MPHQSLRVQKLADKWAVIFGDSLTPVSTHRRAEEAVRVARVIAAREGAELSVFVRELDPSREPCDDALDPPLRSDR